jgi:hypothetical protein
MFRWHRLGSIRFGIVEWPAEVVTWAKVRGISIVFLHCLWPISPHVHVLFFQLLLPAELHLRSVVSFPSGLFSASNYLMLLVFPMCTGSIVLLGCLMLGGWIGRVMRTVHVHPGCLVSCEQIGTPVLPVSWLICKLMLDSLWLCLGYYDTCVPCFWVLFIWLACYTCLPFLVETHQKDGAKLVMTLPCDGSKC